MYIESGALLAAWSVTVSFTITTLWPLNVVGLLDGERCGVALEGRGDEVGRVEELVEGGEAGVEGRDLDPLPAVGLGLRRGGVAGPERLGRVEVEQGADPLDLDEAALLENAPPPSPSPFTSSSNRISVLPWVILPTMCTLPTWRSAAMASEHPPVGRVGCLRSGGGCGRGSRCGCGRRCLRGCGAGSHAEEEAGHGGGHDHGAGTGGGGQPEGSAREPERAGAAGSSVPATQNGSPGTLDLSGRCARALRAGR